MVPVGNRSTTLGGNLTHIFSFLKKFKSSSYFHREWYMRYRLCVWEFAHVWYGFWASHNKRLYSSCLYCTALYCTVLFVYNVCPSVGICLTLSVFCWVAKTKWAFSSIAVDEPFDPASESCAVATTSELVVAPSPARPFSHRRLLSCQPNQCLTLYQLGFCCLAHLEFMLHPE